MSKASHFRIMGLRPKRPGLDVECDFEKVQSIHKALSDNDRWYMLVEGVVISEDETEIRLTSKAKADYSYYDSDQLKISISAIVGRNGSGKSSFIELFVRAINNLSAALLGEGFNFAAAEHLHFIDNVFVEVLFQIENKIYLLKEDGRNIILQEFQWENEAKRYKFWADTAKIINNHYSTDDLLKPQKSNRRILRKLFYTMVCNYSLYGFNYRDFIDESTPAKRLEKLKIQVDDEMPGENSVWLKGIFHKNDGYQTPIVLHPMRDDGQLNIKKENELAKERLISLLFYKNKDGEYPMRTINANLRVDGISFRPSANKKFSKDNILESLGFKKTQNVSIYFDNIYDRIYQYWDSKYGIGSAAENPYFKDACDYIVYKTLKIVLRYKKYHPILHYLSLKNFDYNKLSEKLEPLAFDKSHITKKLRQTINFLINPKFDCEDQEIDLFDWDRQLDKMPEEDPYVFLPPPIFDTDLILMKDAAFKEESGFIKMLPTGGAEVKRAQFGGQYRIKFSALSSGERQIAYTLSNILYHMVNVDSEWNDNYKGKGKKQIIQYRYMNLILDEVELYFHPDLQRQFLFLLLDAIHSVKFKNLKGVNIIIATHSPFILSDIEGCNVLRLGDEREEDATRAQTFAGNIMEMLSDTFFMDSSIGEISRQEISNIFKLAKKISSATPQEILLYKDFFKQNKSYFKRICRSIGDEFIRGLVENAYSQIQKQLSNH